MKIKLNKETIEVFTNEKLNDVYGGQNTDYERCGAPSEGETRTCYSNNCGSGSTDACANTYNYPCDGGGNTNNNECGGGPSGGCGGQGGGETDGGQSCAYCD